MTRGEAEGQMLIVEVLWSDKLKARSNKIKDKKILIYYFNQKILFVRINPNT